MILEQSFLSKVNSTLLTSRECICPIVLDFEFNQEFSKVSCKAFVSQYFTLQLSLEGFLVHERHKRLSTQETHSKP